eukprot:scpid43819/ scgid31388/ Sodium/potassium/calcium exchanger 6; Na(+)/K(+)/Ca(2+)-exchange protein 6; Solute carrier family 24 member 6
MGRCGLQAAPFDWCMHAGLLALLVLLPLAVSSVRSQQDGPESRHTYELSDESNSSSGIPSDWNTIACKSFKTVPLPTNDTNVLDFRCKLVRNFTSCSTGGFIPYLSLVNCSLPTVKPVAYIVLFVWLLFLFVSLGTTAEDFFCPALTTISQTLGLSQNIAGVTFLAIGNGAPDIFSAFAAIQQAKDGDAGLAIGALFGAGVFVTTTVVGAICITRSFALTQRPFLRDVIFYLAAVFWTFYVLWNHEMSTWQAAGFIGLYVFYVLVVIVGRYVYVKRKKRAGTGDIPAPTRHESGRELGQDPSHSSVHAINSTSSAGSADAPTVPTPVGNIQDCDNGDSSDDDNHHAEGADEHQPLLTQSSTNHNRPPPSRSNSSTGASAGGGGYGSFGNHPRPTLVKRTSTSKMNGFVASRLLSQESTRSRSDSFHGVTDHIRDMSSATTPDGEAACGQNGRNGDVFEDDGEMTSLAEKRRAMDSLESRPRMRKSTILVAGALAGLASSSSAAAVPFARMPRLRRTASMGHIDVEAAPAAATTPTEPPSSLMALAQRRQQNPTNEPSARFLPFRTFLLALVPIDREVFSTESWIWKIYDIFKAIIQFLLLLTTPVVMLDQEDQNWNRYTSTMHCVTGPVVIALLVSGVSSFIAGVVPTVAVVGAGGILLACVVFCTSRNDSPPRYHRVFAFFGFLVAVVWIYAIANEIVALLMTFGVSFGISDAILGLTLLAWGNSIGDFVSNVTMAKQGFPRMAIAACFGGPLLNVLLGIGLASLVKSIKNGGKFCLHFRPLQVICASFLMASLSMSLVSMFLLRFNTSKRYGIALICFYCVFLTIAILEEAGVIPWETTYVCPN